MAKNEVHDACYALIHGGGIESFQGSKKDGILAGIKWAENDAGWQELDSVERYYQRASPNYFSEEFLGGNIGAPGHRMWYAVGGTGEPDTGAAQEFLVKLFGEKKAKQVEQDVDFTYGFLAGVRYYRHKLINEID